MLSQKLILRIISDSLCYLEEEIFALTKECQNKHISLEDFITQKGILTQTRLYQLAAKILEIPFIHLESKDIQRDVFFLLPQVLIKTSSLIPYKQEKNKIYVATSDQHSLNFFVRDYLEHCIKKKLIFCLVTPKNAHVLLRVLCAKNYFSTSGAPQEFLGLTQRKFQKILLEYAQHLGATNIKTLSKNSHEHILLYTGKNLTQTFRLPQNLLEHTDMPVPIAFHSSPSFEDLNMPKEIQKKLLHILKKETGVILFTGPKHSQTHTAISALCEKLPFQRTQTYRVHEYTHSYPRGIHHICAPNTKRIHILQTLLRQDADVLIIPDIQNQEEEKIALRAACEGRLVIVSSKKPFDIPSHIPQLIIHKRIIKKICPHCVKVCRITQAHKKKLEDISTPSVIQSLLKSPHYKSKGCAQCQNTGSSGIMRLFALGEKPQTALQEQVIQKILGGVASIDEIFTIA